MKQEPTRRAVLIGGMASTLATLSASSSMAKTGPISNAALQGSADPIVSVPPTLSASEAGKLYITVYPPQNYTPGVQYTVKIVRLAFSADGQGEMATSYFDEYLDGISGGEYQTTVTFPEESGPRVLTVNVEAMATNYTKTYTAVAFNATNGGAAMFQLTV